MNRTIEKCQFHIMVLQVEKFIHDVMQMNIKLQRNLLMEMTILLFLEPRKLLGTARHLLKTQRYVFETTGSSDQSELALTWLKIWL